MSTPSLRLPCALAALLSVVVYAQPQKPPASADKTTQLNRLYEEYWEEVLKLNPIQATLQGDPRYNDQLPNFYSAEYRAASTEMTKAWLKRIEAVGATGLLGQDLLSYEIFVRNAKLELEGEQFPSWMQPINQSGSILIFAAQLGSGTGAQPFKTVKDYDDWLQRGARLPALIDQAVANMKTGIEKGVVQPKPLMEKVLPQIDALTKKRAEDTIFWGPVKRMPKTFSPADKKRLTVAYRAMIADAIVPAYQRLRTFIAEEYLPKTRTTHGLDALPNGKAWYAFQVRSQTTTDMSPDDIHELGLSEVARIHGNIEALMKTLQFKGSLKDFFIFMQKSPRFSFKSEASLLAFFRSLEKKVGAHVAEQFSLTPKAKFEIRPVEAFRAKSASGGQYEQPSEDGSRPGIFYVNTYDLPTRKTWDAEDLYLHEAIPGHHYQIALQQELTNLPKFRRFGGETAFIEGWGLYAESLGKSLGVYTDPYSCFGYLQNELWRAIRLVVDTGLHSKGWTREKVIAYMLENSAESGTQSTSEAERYMAWPGQALAYKIGELKIQALRKRAESTLGSSFDIREFHSEILKEGSLPLNVLDAKISRWMAEKKR